MRKLRCREFNKFFEGHNVNVDAEKEPTTLA
jgi:hypothetical protein